MGLNVKIIGAVKSYRATAVSYFMLPNYKT